MGLSANRPGSGNRCTSVSWDRAEAVGLRAPSFLERTKRQSKREENIRTACRASAKCQTRLVPLGVLKAAASPSWAPPADPTTMPYRPPSPITSHRQGPEPSACPSLSATTGKLSHRHCPSAEEAQNRLGGSWPLKKLPL